MGFLVAEGFEPYIADPEIRAYAIESLSTIHRNAGTPQGKEVDINSCGIHSPFTKLQIKY